MSKHKPAFSKKHFYVSGLHCASCQLIIEKRLIKLPEVQTVDVNLNTNKLFIELDSKSNFNAKDLNKIFAADGYRFSDQPFESSNHQTSSSKTECLSTPTTSNLPKTIFIAFALLIAFILLEKTGFSSLISVNDNSSLPVFFLFGLLAGVSSCAALTGGIVLSLSKQWLSQYSSSDSFWSKSQPHFLFNAGRILSYAVFGGLLGLIGNFFRLSPSFSAVLVIAVSAVMVLLGLQMLGLKALANFRLALPRSLTHHFADESNFQSKYAPLLMGALTFFLPCGFTVTAQALALASSSPLQGSLIMVLFALGTLPGLLAIGLSSVRLYSNPKLSSQFSLVAGALVLFFALFNVNSQLAVLGAPNLNSVISYSRIQNPESNISDSNLPPIVDGKQILKMDASARGYSPSRLKVRAGIPIRWEITDRGTSGCTNAIMSRSLFEGQINLVPGTTSVKEFTVDQPGTYRFTCWMGMVSGTMEVVNAY